MIELWKDIKGYEGLYQISNTGIVRSLDRYVNTSNGKIVFVKGTVKKTRIDSGNRYMLIDLSNQGKATTFLLHRLVANAFICNPNELPQINHKDEDKQNNRVDNLEWCDQLYNSNYGSVKNKIRQSNKKLYERISKKVICINDNKIFNSTVEAGKYYGVDYSNVSRICNGLRKQSKGYRFKYLQT